VSIPAPDPALPPSFDSDTPGHHFRILESASQARLRSPPPVFPQAALTPRLLPQWMVRPMVDSHGWDHESGVEGFTLDKAFLLRKSIPANVQGQVTKDKKDANLTLETEASLKHSDSLITTSGLDVQTVGGRQLAYTARSETRWKNRRNNKTAAGLSASLVGGVVALGAKMENRLKVTPGSKLVLTCGSITANGDTAFGAPLLPRLFSHACADPLARSQVAIWRAACATSRTTRCRGAPLWAPPS
jgi:hypothetical protein